MRLPQALAASRTAAASRAAGARALVASVRALVAAVLFLAAAPPPLAAAPVSVRVSLTPATLGLDETATLTIEAAGGGLGGFRFEPSYMLDNLEPVEGPSRYEDLSLINGSLSQSYRFSLRLRPLAVGPARVRSLVLKLRGQLVRLQDQEIRVQEQPAGQSSGAVAGGRAQPGEPEDLFEQLFGRDSPLAQAPRAQGPAAFLRAELQPPRPLVGEQAVYTIYLYTRQDVAAINATAMPSFQGFWVRDLPQPAHLTPEMVSIGADRYGRVAMIRKALFALRPGPHTLEPAGCDVVVEPQSRGFFGPPMVRPEELHLRTPELAVDVQPLPAAPAGFGGLVGQVSLAAKLQPYSLRLGEGAVLTITLAGAGHLQGVPAPRLQTLPGLTVFPPQQQSEDHVSGATVEGRRIWTYVIVPNRPGRYDVRPQAIAYFDPAHHEYRLAAAPALALTALPAPAAATAGSTNGSGGGAGAGATAPPGRRGAAARGDQAPPWWPALPRIGPARNPWIVLSSGLVLAAMLAAMLALTLARRRRHLAAAGPPAAAAGAAGGIPSRPAAGGAPETPAAAPALAGAAIREEPARPAEVERKLREAAHEDRPRHAAALVEEGWRGYLAGRWGLPATTPPARWGAVLAARGVAADIADEVSRLVEELHYLRYAPQLSTTGAVRDEVLSRSRQLLRRLR